MKQMEIRHNLGKKSGTMMFNNWMWVKKFDNGVKIRKKGQGIQNQNQYPKKLRG